MNSLLLEQPPRYARYQGQLYLVESESGDRITLRHHEASGGDWVAVYLTMGAPMVHKSLVTLNRRDCDFLKTEAIQPPPPIPLTDGLQVGSRVKWGTSLAEWAIVALSGDTATIRQTSGWAMGVSFEAPVTELSQVSKKISA